MADRIKGITIEVGGDTTGLSKALSGVNKNIRDTQGQLKDVERLLKLDPSNTELLSQKQKLLGQAVGGTKEKLDALKKANEGVTANNAKYEQWRSAFAPIQSQITKTTDKLEALKKQQKEMEKAGNINTDAYHKLQGEVENTEGKLGQLKQKATDTYNELGRPMSTEQYDSLQREIVDTEQQLKKLEDQAGKSNVALQKISQAGEKVQEFGGKVSSAGEALLPVTGIITAAGGASAKMAMDFEDAMAKVNTIADTTKVPLSDLEKSILDLSNQTGISSTEIADNVYNAISAGQKTGDAVNFVANSTKLAKAGFADAGSALDILTTIMNAYGLEADEVNKVSDILIQTQNLGKTTVGELSAAMGKVIPTAKANGVALDQVAAGYAIMTSNGIGTAETTTYMNAMLNELGKSGTKVSDIIKGKTGKSFKELMDGGSSLADVLQIVSDSADDQGLAFGDMWGSAAAGKAALTLLKNGADGFNGTLGEMRDSTGATETAFEKLDTKSYELQKTVNQLKNDAIAMGKALLDTLAPILKKVSQKTQELHKWFEGLSEDQKEMVVKVGLLVAALGPLLIVLGQIITGIGGVMTAVSSIGPLFAAGGPVILAVAAVGLLAAAIYGTKKKADEYYHSLADLSDSEQENKEKVDSLKESYDELAKKQQESVDNIDSQAQHESDLWAELKSITDENGNIKDGQEARAKFITGELSKALGIEIDITDNQIQKYKDLTAEIDTVIEKKRQEATLAAFEEGYRDALKDKAGAQDAYTQALSDSKTATEEYNAAATDMANKQAALNEVLRNFDEDDSSAKGKLNDATQAFQKAQDAAAPLKDHLDQVNQTLADSEAAWVGVNTTIQDYEGAATAIISGDQQSINQSLLKLTNGFQTCETGTRASLENQVQTLTEKYNDMQDAVKAGAPSVTQAQVDQMKDLVGLSKQELDKMPTAAEQAARNTTQAIIDGNDGCRSAGSESMKAYTGGISEKIPEVAAAADQVAETAANNVKANIPLADAWGSDMMVGYIKGIKGKIGELESACRSVAGTVSDYLHFTRPEKGPLRDYEEWMPHMMKGIAEGIKENEDIVGAAAGDAASRIGEELAAGIADGVKQNKKNAQKSAEELAKAVLDAAQKKLKNEEVYRKLSLSEEVDYWNSVRKQVAEGTEARIGADEKYFKSKQDLNKKMQSAEEKYTNSVAKAYEDLNKEVKKLNQEYRDAVDSRTSEIRNAFGLFDEFTADTDQTSDKLLSNLQSQVDGLKDWRDNLNTLERRGIGDGLLTELQKLGPQSAAQIKLLTQMTDDQLNQYVNLFQQKNRIARKQAVDELAPMRNDITNQITELKRQTSKDLADYQEQYMESMSELGVALSQPAENMKLMMAQNAVEMVSGLASSIQKESGSAENTEKFKAIAENILNATGTLQADMQSVGQNAIAGIIAGLQSKEAELYAVAEGIAQRVTQAMQDTFQIHSPSVVMREKIGKNLMLGLRDGMEKYKNLAAAAVTVGMNFTGIPEGNRNNWTGIEMAELMGLLTKYLPEIAQQKCIALDGKTLVGQTVGAMDRQLANTQHLKGRIG